MAEDGIHVEVNERLIEEHRRAMARLLVSDPETRKQLKAVIRAEIKNARNKISSDIHGNLDNDPRKAYRAVKYSIYKKVLGGNTSILSSRRAGARYLLIRPRKLDENPHQPGGNRVPRSPDAERMETYFGKDRGFVLRFLNAGVKDNGTVDRETRLGKRGVISPRYVFEGSAPGRMSAAAEAISNAFAGVFEEVYNEEMKQ